jgi:uncharacterized peroxidase-related enzyme
MATKRKEQAGEEPRAQVTPEQPTALELPQDELSPEMEAYFALCLEKLGFVPNVLRAYALDNAKLEAFVALSDDLMRAPSGLSRLEREMIAVAVSCANRCFYCLTAHGAAVMNHRGADLSPRHRAMLDFAWKLTESPAEVGEADRELLRSAGFSERDIWDLAAVAAFYNMTNRLASAVDMRPNDEYHRLGR